MTVLEAQPTPDVRDIFDSLDGRVIFSALDLCSAYWTIPMDPESARLAAISTPWGVFAFKRLGMGQRNASFYLQELITRALGDLLGTIVLAYADDLLIASGSEEEHVEHVQQVLGRLAEAGIRLSPAKCTFGAREINYLGHVLRPQEIAPQQVKVQRLMDMRAPATRTELRSLYGLASYYRGFIKDLAVRTPELHRLMKDSERYVWTKEAQAELDWVKRALAAAPSLRIPSARGLLTLETDASDQAIGWVLNQEVDQSPHPVLFGSERLNKIERGYAAVEKEALAIVKSMQACSRFLLGTHFRLVTDARSLKYIYGDGPLSNAMKEAKVGRWRLILQGFDYEIVYRSGLDNIADPLSRLVPVETTGPSPLETPIAEIEERVFSAQIPEVAGAIQVRQVATGTGPTGVGADERGEDAPAEGQGPPSAETADLVHQMALVAEAHLPTHEPVVTTLQRLFDRNVAWDGMRASVQAYVDACPTCQRFKDSGRYVAPAQFFIETARVWDTVALDHVGPLQLGSAGATHLFTLMDIDTGFFLAFRVPDSSAERVVEVLTRLCDVYGRPDRFLTDMGAAFTSERFSRFCIDRDVKHAMTSPYHPQSNKNLERQHGVLKARLRVLLADGYQFDEALSTALHAINTRVSTSRGERPFDLFYGRAPKGVDSPESGKTIEERRKEARTRRHGAAAERAVLAARSARPGPREGDRVLLFVQQRAALGPRFRGPYEVARTALAGPGQEAGVNVEIRDARGVRRLVHVTHLKPYVGGETPLAGDLRPRARPAGPDPSPEEEAVEVPAAPASGGQRVVPRPMATPVVSATREPRSLRNARGRGQARTPAPGVRVGPQGEGLEVVGTERRFDTRWYYFTSPDGSGNPDCVEEDNLSDAQREAVSVYLRAQRGQRLAQRQTAPPSRGAVSETQVRAVRCSAGIGGHVTKGSIRLQSF
jgi:hypothetical protein